MIEYHATAQQRMTREQCIVSLLMIRAELDKIKRLFDEAMARCEAAKDD